LLTTTKNIYTIKQFVAGLFYYVRLDIVSSDLY